LNKLLPILTSLKLSPRAEISALLVLFIHLKLVDNNTSSGLFKLTYQFLAPYFPHGGITYEEVAFDIAIAPKANNYQSKSIDRCRIS
jgi:hypothetical protein